MFKSLLRLIVVKESHLIPQNFHKFGRKSIYRQNNLRKFSTMTNENAAKKAKTDVVIGTHDGVFHCDEILACFMLQQLPEYENATILRTRDLTKLAECDIVVDVGAVFDVEKKRFDHHQREFTGTMSSLKPEVGPDFDIKLSSAGLVYCYYGEDVIKNVVKKYTGTEIDLKCLKTVYRKLYESFIREIDAIDNGVPQFEGEPRWTISTNLSSRVSHFNQTWNSKEPYDAQSQFEKAKELVGGEFVDKIRYYTEVWWAARAIVQKTLENRFNVHESGEILELSEFCPWKQHLAELEHELKLEGVAKYVLYENKSDDWRVICVPTTPDSFVCRKFLHKDWRGIRDEELEKVSGIKGINFCHATGFIGGAKTREAALQMAVQSLEADY
ncbi:MYG1 protein [Culicoides brevitarsis]|uniref:MYG1 protein n=1 Tax=Culicoides brevitarsis TaxID=469753 RepID=UPI00307B3AF6